MLLTSREHRNRKQLTTAKQQQQQLGSRRSDASRDLQLVAAEDAADVFQAPYAADACS
jgi:hypothetical protein